MPNQVDIDYIQARVWVDPRTGCWLWLKGTNGKYGHGKRNNKRYAAHRLSFEIYKGPIGSLNVCHSCDIPLCCNPDHLFLGTQKENIQDAFNKGRLVAPTTKTKEDHPNSKLTETQVQQIRQRVAAGETKESVAADFGISGVWVGRITRNEVWRL